MNYKRSIRDTVGIRVTSADIWSSIQLLNQSAIPVFRVRQEDELTFTFEIHRKNLRLLRSLLERRGDRITLVQITLLHGLARSLLRRPLLYGGLSLFFLLSLLLPTRILAVEVEGNGAVPTRAILEAAEEAGIRLFSSCAGVRSERMKNALLSSIPALQWAGINTYGCRAVISVRERSEQEQSQYGQGQVSSIVASRDGIIQSFTALRGSVQCREGEAVKQGQVLISGFTDCGLTIRAEQAQGEVYAQTLRTIRSVTPSGFLQRTETLQVERRYALLLGKNRINFWKDSGIWDSTCGRISREYRLTLPGGFSLPVALTCETLYRYAETETAGDDASARNELKAFSQHYLLDQMIAGTITQGEETLESRPGVFLMTSRYLCREMIGRERLENGVQHEQDN